MTIYLDYAATTPIDPRVAAVMTEFLTDPLAQANPASVTHGPGMRASDCIDQARSLVARLIGAQPAEIVFTSGATEANNLAILGVASAALRACEAGRQPGHFVSSRVEHKSVLDVLKQLEKAGFSVTLLEPDEAGRVPPEAVSAALRADTLMVSLMMANNEIGVLTDIVKIGELARARGVLVHTDASQAVGKIPVDVLALNVDFLSLTAHKFYGPKGVGALYVREIARPRIAPIQFGGGHERGLRSGTLPTHQIVGLGVAAALARDQLAQDSAHACDLVARLRRELEEIPGVEFNSRPEGVPGILNASFPGVEGESLVTSLTGIALSTGSACSSATREPSYVLRALGRDTELAQSSLRISLGRFTVAADVDEAATAIRNQVMRLRSIAGAAVAGYSPVVAPANVPGSLMDRALNEPARQYFRAPPRVPARADGGAHGHLRQGRAGRTADGAQVAFELKIVDGTVKSAHFSAYGCPHTLAVAAWLCEVLEGRRIAEGIPGTPADWAAKFEAPVEKLGRFLIVEDALKACFAPVDRG